MDRGRMKEKRAIMEQIKEKKREREREREREHLL